MIYLFLALLNGILIGLARSLNGRIAASRNAIFASWVNHIVGFAALTLMTLFIIGPPMAVLTLPPYLFLGGAIGALYVTLNAYIVPKLGVTNATLLVIAGQMLMSIFLDVWLGKIVWHNLMAIGVLVLGCGLLLVGFYQLVKAPK